MIILIINDRKQEKKEEVKHNILVYKVGCSVLSVVGCGAVALWHCGTLSFFGGERTGRSYTPSKQGLRSHRTTNKRADRERNKRDTEKGGKREGGSF